MKENVKQTILFILIVIGMPMLANVIVEIASSIITVDMLMKCVYFVLGLILIYFRKVGI